MIGRTKNIYIYIVCTMSLLSSLYWTENSGSTSAGDITVNQSNTAGGSGFMCPETPESERKNTIDGK